MTVLDEARAEEAIALLVHDAGAAHGEGWRALRIHAEPNGGGGRTEDAESCARQDGRVYLMGSQFGRILAGSRLTRREGRCPCVSKDSQPVVVTGQAGTRRAVL